ncbi:LYR family protein [Penicillium odoratum]|uniref:LYR family protein n=1 Tax=Penicillium odoratum TaxID=1167516 RepID=UPI002548DF88|nr:LYR family protein [Penicillium odoratum]KAJ5772143.1 LYR family protein [Penicillium odoratum]
MSVANLHRETGFQVRSLFRSLMRQSTQFSNYNFREYAIRKTRDSFREHQNETEDRRIQELIQSGLQDLRLLKRQTTISQFYQMDKLVVEGQKTGKETGEHGGIVRQKDDGYFRSSRSGRQLDGNRRTGQIDHDVFEGLPVRRWSRQPHTYSQVPKTEDSEFTVQGPGGTAMLPELAMPRDSQLLGASSRALLRAARAGCIYIHQNARAPDEDDKTAVDGEEGIGGAHLADRAFTSRKWMTLPKHLEPAEVEFLAKRRSGLPSLYGGATSVDGSGPGPMRRTKFKKTDPETGKISIYEAWVPEGHRIEGEITGDVQAIVQHSAVPVNAEMPAPGTVVEGVGIVNSEGVVVAEAGSASVMTPPKRRPPPPKRKGKGIGKGRKKKVMFAPGEGADAATVHGVSAGANSGGGAPSEGQDASQMSIDQSGQDDDDEDGDDGDDSDEGDESMIDAKTPETPQALSVTQSEDQPTVDTLADSKDVEMSDATFEPQSHVSEPSAGQEVVPQLSAIPKVPQAEPAFTAPGSTAQIAGTTAPEQPSDIDNQPTGAGSLDPPVALYQPEALSHLASEGVSREEPLALGPTPAAKADTTIDSLAEGPVSEPVQVAAEISATDFKESRTPSEITSASIGLDKTVEGVPSKPWNEPESENISAETSWSRLSEKPFETSIPPPAEYQDTEPAPVLNDTENTKKDLSGGPESGLDSIEPKEDVEMGDAPSEPQQSIQPEEPIATEAPANTASPSTLEAQAPTDEAPGLSPLEPAAGNSIIKEEFTSTEIQPEELVEKSPPRPTEQVAQQVPSPAELQAEEPAPAPAPALEEKKDDIEPQAAPAPEFT